MMKVPHYWNICQPAALSVCEFTDFWRKWFKILNCVSAERFGSDSLLWAVLLHTLNTANERLQA